MEHNLARDTVAPNSFRSFTILLFILIVMLREPIVIFVRDLHVARVIGGERHGAVHVGIITAVSSVQVRRLLPEPDGTPDAQEPTIGAPGPTDTTVGRSSWEGLTQTRPAGPPLRRGSTGVGPEEPRTRGFLVPTGGGLKP